MRNGIVKVRNGRNRFAKEKNGDEKLCNGEDKPVFELNGNGIAKI